jgi:AraC family transcriptional regulator, positive regulator of tynA and feaB
MLLFEQGTSLQRLIVSRRLDHCRRALEDPSQARRTMTDIAFAWGFSDLSHFDRRFKAEYGCSPRDYRPRFLTSWPRAVRVITSQCRLGAGRY